MSEKFTTVKRNYDLGMWDEAKVRKAVAKNWITVDEFKLITGHGLLGE